MATKYQHPPRPIGHPIVQKPRTKKTTAQQPPSTIANNSKEIKIRFGNNSPRDSMYKPSSILKKKTFEQPHSDHENMDVWDKPSNLETIISRPFYSPIHTPPRLRTLITPPGLEPYRNQHKPRGLNDSLPIIGPNDILPITGLNDSLPIIDDWHAPPAHPELWGLDPSNYHLNSNHNLLRRYPSPLSNYGLRNPLHGQKKSYIVVPRLNNFVSPPVSRGNASFTLPSHRRAPIYVPESQYTYLERIHSFSSPRFHREPSDYVYIRQNEAFANRYIEDFIGRNIEDQLVPDLLLEIIGELDQENKKRGGKSYQKEVDRYNLELNKRIDQGKTNNTHLFSDDWRHQVDNQLPPIQTTNRLRYHDLPSDVQGRLLADINQQILNSEIENMMTDLSGQALTDRNHHNIESETVREVKHYPTYDTPRSQKHQIDPTQHNSIQKYVQTKLIDTICLDQLILSYIKQHGSAVDTDDLSRLVDGNILENLIYQQQDIDENRSRTLDNYASKKFHLNSFMNITMDLLLTELSASLIEDMKDLDEQEQRMFL